MCGGVCCFFSMSRVVWECSPKTGGEFHLKLNTRERPIVHKYREGKMQRTLKRELKGLEIVKREAFEVPIRSFLTSSSIVWIATLSQQNSVHFHCGNARFFLLSRERDCKKSHSKGVVTGSGATWSFCNFALLMSFKIEPLFHWWNGCTFRCVESQHQFSAQCFTALVATTGKSLQVNPLKVTFPFNFWLNEGRSLHRFRYCWEDWGKSLIETCGWATDLCHHLGILWGQELFCLSWVWLWGKRVSVVVGATWSLRSSRLSFSIQFSIDSCASWDDVPPFFQLVSLHCRSLWCLLWAFTAQFKMLWQHRTSTDPSWNTDQGV